MGMPQGVCIYAMMEGVFAVYPGTCGLSVCGKVCSPGGGTCVFRGGHSEVGACREVCSSTVVAGVSRSVWCEVSLLCVLVCTGEGWH